MQIPTPALPHPPHLQCLVVSVESADLLLQLALLPQQLLHCISKQAVIIITSTTQTTVLL